MQKVFFYFSTSGLDNLRALLLFVNRKDSHCCFCVTADLSPSLPLSLCLSPSPHLSLSLSLSLALSLFLSHYYTHLRHSYLRCQQFCRRERERDRARERESERELSRVCLLEMCALGRKKVRSLQFLSLQKYNLTKLPSNPGGFFSNTNAQAPPRVCVSVCSF